MKLSHVILLSASLPLFQSYAMNPYEIVDQSYEKDVIYSPEVFVREQDW